MSDLKTNNMPIIFKKVRRHPIRACTFVILQRKDNITYLNCIRNITKMRKNYRNSKMKQSNYQDQWERREGKRTIDSDLFSN